MRTPTHHERKEPARDIDFTGGRKKPVSEPLGRQPVGLRRFFPHIKCRTCGERGIVTFYLCGACHETYLASQKKRAKHFAETQGFAAQLSAWALIAGARDEDGEALL